MASKGRNQHSKSNSKQEKEVSVTGVMFLIVTGFLLLAVYLKYVPEGSSAQLSVSNNKASRLESCPSMLELETMYSANSEGRSMEVSVLDECESSNLGEELRKALGIPDDRISVVIRKMPMAYCRAVFQQWYNGGSTSSKGYPINWVTAIAALKTAGLTDVAEQVNNIILK